MNIHITGEASSVVTFSIVSARSKALGELMAFSRNICVNEWPVYLQTLSRWDLVLAHALQYEAHSHHWLIQKNLYNKSAVDDEL